jgi:uracil-DNA glycosylase
MTDTVSSWRTLLDARTRPRRVPLPHPSWRNNAWLAANPWFERDLLPRLRGEIGRLLQLSPPDQQVLTDEPGFRLP